MLKNLTKRVKKMFSMRGSKKAQGRRLIYMVLGIVVVYCAYKTMMTPKGRVIEGLENGKKTLVLFHMKGCGHCDKMMPEWDAFEKDNNTGVSSKKLERSEAGGLLEKHNVGGFPTILLLDNNDNKVAAYNGERTKQGFLAFCDKNK